MEPIKKAIVFITAMAAGAIVMLPVTMYYTVALAQTPDDMLELSDKQAALRDAQAAVLKAQADYDVVRKRVVESNVSVVKTVQAAISAEDVAALKADVAALKAEQARCKQVTKDASVAWNAATTIRGVVAAARPLFACLGE